MLRVEGVPIAHIVDDPIGDVLDRQHQIHKARRDRAQRHLGETRPRHIRALRDGQSTILLDRLETQGAVAAAAGKHDADCMLRLVLGQRAEEEVDRGPLVIRCGGVPKAKPASADGQDRAGRENIDMLRFDHFAVPCVDDRHFGSAADDLGQHALAIGRKVGHDHKAHAVIGRHGLEEPLQRLDATRRGTDPDDRKIGHHGFSPRSAPIVINGGSIVSYKALL